MTKCRLAVVGAALFVGFFVASYLDSTVSFVIFAALITAAAVSHFIKRKSVVFLLTAAAAAFLVFGIYRTVFIDPCAKLYGEIRSMTATVLSVGEPVGDKVRLTLEGETDGTRLRYSLYTLNRGYRSGDIVDVTAEFSEPMKTARYGTDYDFSRGIFVRARALNVYPRGEHTGLGIYRAINGFSEYLRSGVRETLRGDERALLLAMFFGDKSLMRGELSGAVTRSGLAHMTAVSGMHLSLTVGVFAKLLELIFRRRKRLLRFTVLTALVLAFMVFFGMSASVSRSGIMMIICYGALLFRRKDSIVNSLGAAATLILLVEPCACRDAGLVMSVVGTLGIGVVSPWLCTALRKHFHIGIVAEFVISCFCASYCTLPVSALVFGNCSLAAPISSVLVYPFFYGAMLCALVGMFLPVMYIPAGIMLAPVAAYVRFVSGLRYVSLSFADYELVPFFAVSAVFIAAAVVLVRKKRVGELCVPAAAAICGCALAGVVIFGKASETGITEIRIYSDGSDCAAAVCGETGVSLFTTDVSDGISDAARDILNEKCADRFELVCVSAPREHRAMYSDTLLSLETTELRYLENGNAVYDIGGRYSVRAYGSSVIMEINGVSVIIADITDAGDLGAADIAIYSGWRRQPAVPANNVTIFCDKRFPPENNAYYEKTVIKIAQDVSWHIN